MGNRVWWGIGAVGVLLLAALIAAAVRVPRCEIRLSLSGAGGGRVVGSYTADGVRHGIDEELPAEIRCVARDFEFEVRGADGPRALAAIVLVNGVEYASTSTGAGGITGGFRNGILWGTSGGIHTF